MKIKYIILTVLGCTGAFMLGKLLGEMRADVENEKRNREKSAKDFADKFVSYEEINEFGDNFTIRKINDDGAINYISRDSRKHLVSKRMTDEEEGRFNLKNFERYILKEAFSVAEPIIPGGERSHQKTKGILTLANGQAYEIPSFYLYSNY